MKFTTFIPLFLTSLFCLASGLRFDLEESREPYCIRDFASPGQLVVVDITTDEANNIFIKDTAGNEYRKKKDIYGEVKIMVLLLLMSVLSTLNARSTQTTRFVELDIEIGSQARDWNKIQAVEKLKPIEVELRRIEELTDEIVDELQFLKVREERLRDTNESTNKRVKFFSISIIILLLILGAWQVSYLRNYFKSKHII
ncbi:hypothetical protein ACO0SA_003972 [Hanseniaspora valbyensis]